jgi:hypothetical protein
MLAALKEVSPSFLGWTNPLSRWSDDNGERTRSARPYPKPANLPYDFTKE